MPNRLIVISGCSGGGKSSLLAELERRSCAIVEEPGRRVIATERAFGGRALPWVDPAAFAKRAAELARADLAWAAQASGRIFFDRSLVDAAAALEQAAGVPLDETLAGERYAKRVFLAPPWPEIYVKDEDRRHDFAQGAAEYERLVQAYRSQNYETVVLPRSSVGARADFVLGALTLR